MSTILDENTSETPSQAPEYLGFTKRVMGTFIELINIWGVQVILYSYLGFSRVTSELYALTLIWFIKVVTEMYGKPTIGRVATNGLVHNDVGSIPSWQQVIVRNSIWTIFLLFFWGAQIAVIMNPETIIESGDIWSWLSMYVSEKLMLYTAVLIFLIDRTTILLHPKNKSVKDILAHTVVVQND